MDPATAAAFATIVSLLADFVAHRKANEAQSLDEFMAWLSETRHEEVRRMLEQQSGTTVAIKALLSESQNDVLARLAALDKSLAGLASGLDSFRAIANAAHPAAALSEQAMSILQQFNDSGASKMMEMPYMEGTEYAFIDGSGELEISEARFLEDDLDTLVSYGLLTPDSSPGGKRIFRFTRAAASLLSQGTANR